MVDREPRYDPTSEYLVTASVRDCLTVADRAVNTLKTDCPDLYSALQTSTETIEGVSPKTSPSKLHAIAMVDHMIMHMSEAGLEVSKDVQTDLFNLVQTAATLESQVAIHTSLQRIAGIEFEDEISLRKGLHRIKHNPGRAVREGKHALEDASLLVDEPGDAFLENLSIAYHATLLSGNLSTYKHVNRACAELLRQIKQAYPGVRVIAKHLRQQPEILRELLNEPLGEIADAIPYYNSVRMLTSTMVATDLEYVKHTVAANRFALLDFAEAISFHPTRAHDFSTLLPLQLSRVINLSSEPRDYDFEFLPKGTRLVDFAYEIVEEANRKTENTRPTIDPHRLQILENIRQIIGEDRTEYARGVRKSRRIIRENDKEQPDEYIILVIQHLDEAGAVIREDAVAESPIAGDNALYIQRQDINGWDWRELLAAPKSDVLAMGARAVQHRVPKGTDLVTSMTQKTLRLLNASPDEFLHGEFAGRLADGSPRLHVPRRVLDQIITSIDTNEQ